MYFILFDPIFWINKTLATFDRMQAKLQKLVEKCEKELERNMAVVSLANQEADRKRGMYEAFMKKHAQRMQNQRNYLRGRKA
jgi:hypothetical protein